MVTQELINYIEECRKLGHSDSQIRAALRKEGWGETDVLEAMFKYTKPKKKTPKGLFLAGLITVVLLIALIIGGVFFMLNDIEKISQGVEEVTRNSSLMDQNNNENNTQGADKTYRNEVMGFEVKYPSDIFVLDAGNATLTHTLKSFHKYSLKDGSDLGLAEDIKIVFKKDITECDNADDTMDEISEPFVSGDLRGLKYEMGAEGEGVVYYCFRNDDGENIFLIQRYFLSDAWSTELPKQSDFIPLEKQAEIFDELLANFKLL